MVANIHAHNQSQDFKSMKERMPYVRALATSKGWLFGPSKFIGYKDMPREEYIGRSDEELDERATESILQQGRIQLSSTTTRATLEGSQISPLASQSSEVKINPRRPYRAMSWSSFWRRSIAVSPGTKVNVPKVD